MTFLGIIAENPLYSAAVFGVTALACGSILWLSWVDNAERTRRTQCAERFIVAPRESLSVWVTYREVENADFIMSMNYPTLFAFLEGEAAPVQVAEGYEEVARLGNRMRNAGVVVKNFRY